MSPRASPASDLTTRVAAVAVDAVADRPERTFSYLLDPGLGEPAPGSLVLVPYGSRLALGYLIQTTAGMAEGPALKPVEAIVSEPMLTDDLLALAHDLAVYYRAPIGGTLAAMLPPGLESRLRRRWRVVDPALLPAGLRETAELDADGLLEDSELLRFAPVRGAAAWLDRLSRSRAIAAAWELRPPEVRPRRVRTIRRLPGERTAPRRAPLQRSILAALDDVPLDLPQLAEALGTSATSLLGPARRLAATGHVVLDWRDVTRDPLAHRVSSAGLQTELAEEQRRALEALDHLPSGGELLLEGVAASGKTDVYLAAIAEVVEQGGSVIVLVPEVSLVPQLGDRLSGIFGERLTVLHSALSAGERHDSWWRILRGEVRVVLGTRTAIFAPLQDLRLIVVDEEHDGGYKSDRTPRYDARWVARRRAALTGARLVLGSATPDLVTVARVRGRLAERARLVERRVGGAPHVDVVDMRAELANGNRSVLSRTLVEAMVGLGPDRGQGILLINRRGASTFILCRDCGESLRCPDCDLPFVFHLAEGNLRCHHCGRRAAVPGRCPHCGSARIRYFGAGTQRVEAEVRDRFPRLRVARLDSDALAARRAFESVYDDFRDGRTDVLVGTQLVAKGLDLPAVTLAAIIAADITLSLPDYRAAERTFQLLAQVAGRAGRGPRPGRVIFQTYAPEHFAIRAAARLDLDTFADEELARRRLLGYPPSGVLARLLIADPDQRRAEARGAAAAEAVRTAGVDVFGPLPAYVARRAGRWRVQVVLRAADVEQRAEALARVPAGVAIDVDPESLL
ncbi:MAG: primosomal protein N' [Chloroflexi bacterium]|nr:MAG: primosomal protein N' [Chloroflexota bacterium]